MKTIKMVAKKSNPYGNKSRAIGDEVDVRKGDVRLMTALGWFAPVEDRPPAPAAAPAPAPARAPAPVAAKTAPKVQTRALSAAERVPALPEDPPPQPDWVGADDAAAKPGDEEAKTKLGTYQRRDLRAEP